MGEARAAARRTRSPTRIKKGDPRAGLLYEVGPRTLQILSEPRMARTIFPISIPESILLFLSIILLFSTCEMNHAIIYA